jgi:GTP-binding protein
MSTLGHLSRVDRVVADDGRAGLGSDKTGKKGKDRTIEVPMGTVVWREPARDAGPDEQNDELIADLVEPNMKVAIARGGESGRGNHRFTTPSSQEPMFAEVGLEGDTLRVFLEVKVLGDIALVGAPNAGKSTLLSVVSRAKPKIADYPFTTTEPVLGVVYHKGRELVFVDVPGLIEGASEGRGLGLDFLKHTERVRALVHLIDGSVENVGKEFSRVAAELEAYPGELGAKPCIVVLNKVDIPEVRERTAEKAASLEAASGQRPMVISGASYEGVEQLLDRVLPLVPQEPEDWAAVAPEMVAEETATARTQRRDRVTVERVAMDESGDDMFVVHCHQIERFVPMINFGNWRAKLQFYAELERLGVIDALEQAGVEAGSTVRIGKRELEWD